MSEYCISITSVNDEKKAELIAKTLVENRLVACSQIFPHKSLYRWEGEICREAEFQIMSKMQSALSEQVQKVILDIHPYEIPEIIFIPIEFGFHPYLDWISKSTS